MSGFDQVLRCPDTVEIRTCVDPMKLEDDRMHPTAKASAVWAIALLIVQGCASHQTWLPPANHSAPTMQFTPFVHQPVAPSRAIRPKPGVVSTGHWIKWVRNSGAIIGLEDGTVWRVSPLDKINSMIWIPFSNIIITESDDVFYPFRLINTDDKETVAATLLAE